MQSSTKARITESDLKRIITAWRGCQIDFHSSTELREGCYNATHLVELRDGRRVVVKVAPDERVPVMRYERGLMTAEVDVLQRLQQSTKVPVPSVLYHDITQRVIPYEYFVMEFIDGRPLHHLREELSLEEARTIDLLIGQHVRSINGQEGESFGYVSHRQARFECWADAFDDMLSNVLDDGEDAGVQLDTRREQIYRLCRSVYAPLELVCEPKLVHWDVWDGNIIIDQESLDIVGILDCERALWGDPLLEVNFRDFCSSSGFIEGYGQAMLSTESARTRCLLYDIYLYLIMVIECVYRSYPNDNQERWAREKLQNALSRLGDRACS